MSLGNIVFLSAVEIGADFALQRYAWLYDPTALLAGIAGYGGVVALIIVALRGGSLLYVNSVWDGVSALMESAAAMVFLGERFERPSQYAGLAFVIAGLFLLK